MEKLLEKTVQVTVQQENPHLDPEVSILLVDDPAIQELNCQYRGIDRPTDVLSFAMEEETEDSPPFISPEEDNILGDIVISLETARRQAEEYGHSLERELGFLTVHGVLHLLGYDHGTKEEETTMRAKEEAVLGVLDLTR